MYLFPVKHLVVLNYRLIQNRFKDSECVIIGLYQNHDEYRWYYKLLKFLKHTCGLRSCIGF